MVYLDQNINIVTISQVKHQVEVKNILYFCLILGIFQNIRYSAEYSVLAEYSAYFRRRIFGFGR